MPIRTKIQEEAENGSSQEPNGIEKRVKVAKADTGYHETANVRVLQSVPQAPEVLF